MTNRSRIAAILVASAIAGWAAWSYWHGGLIASLAGGEDSMETLRAAIARAGVFGPLLYVAAVTVEVVVAPIPGTLLYAPAGAIFGGALGGALSLAGNVIGAALATWIGGAFGAGMIEGTDNARLREYGARIRARGLLVVTLLRLNPLTSSDLVSYAAGIVGVPPWRVALGTAIGMAPLCFAQAYAAGWLFEVLPGSGLIVLGIGLAYLVVVIIVVTRSTLSGTRRP